MSPDKEPTQPSAPSSSRFPPESKSRQLTLSGLVYGIIRMIQMLWMSAVMPLSIRYIKLSGVHLSGLDLFVFYFIGCLWAIMLVMMDQLGYPSKLGKASMTTLGTAGVVVFAWLASAGNILFSAYTIFISSLFTTAALFFAAGIYMGRMNAIESKEKTKGTVSDKKTMFWVVIAYFLFSALSILYGLKFIKPYVAYVLNLRALHLKIFAIVSVGWQIVAWGIQVLRSTVLSGSNPDQGDNADAFQEWMVPICILMVLSVVVALFMFM